MVDIDSVMVSDRFSFQWFIVTRVWSLWFALESMVCQSLVTGLPTVSCHVDDGELMIHRP